MNYFFKIVFPIFIFAVFTANAYSAAPQDPYFSCYTNTEPSKCAETIEKGLLAPYSTTVSRKGDALLLQLKNGHTLTLRNDDSEGDGSIRYFFVSFLPDLDSWLIAVNHYEGLDYMLINSVSGKIAEHIESMPVLSPDKSRFISLFAEDDEAGGNQIQIWKKAGDNILLEWSLQWSQGSTEPQGSELSLLADWKPEEATWLQNDRIALKVTNAIQEQKNIQLRLSNAKWTLDGLEELGKK